MVQCCYNLLNDWDCPTHIYWTQKTPRTIEGAQWEGRGLCVLAGGGGAPLDWPPELHSRAGMGCVWVRNPPQALQSVVAWEWVLSRWVGTNRLITLEDKVAAATDLPTCELGRAQTQQRTVTISLWWQCPVSGTKVMVLVSWLAFLVLLLCQLLAGSLRKTTQICYRIES